MFKVLLFRGQYVSRKKRITARVVRFITKRFGGTLILTIRLHDLKVVQRAELIIHVVPGRFKIGERACENSIRK